MRLIDADALMADLEKWLTQIDPTHPPEDNAIPPMDDIIVSTLMTIEEQPTIEPQKVGRWIPVTERLPEDGVTVWVTIKGHDVIRCEDGETLEQAVARISKMRRVSEGFWCEDDKTWYNAGGYPMMVQPIARMPIDTPEPYKGETK